MQPPPGDSDGDGCSDTQESGTDPVFGGQRSYLKFWDFFDAAGFEDVHDRAISGVDFFAVLSRYGAEAPGYPVPPPESQSLAEAHQPPPPAPAYHASHDRSPPPEGANAWDTGPPDGAITGADMFAVLTQFGHTCAE